MTIKTFLIIFLISFPGSQSYLLQKNIPKYGDHIYVKRHTNYLGFPYTHHGIYVGSNSLIDSPDDYHVIHYYHNKTKTNGIIQKTTLHEFIYPSNINDLQIQNYGNSWNPFSIYNRNSDIPETVVKRAYKRLNENSYDLRYNNCEHFATYCKTGVSSSDQVKNTKTATATIAILGSLIAIYNSQPSNYNNTNNTFSYRY